MANRKEYEMLFNLSAKMGSSFNSTFKSAQSTITAMQQEIQALSKTQGDISAYQKQQAAVDSTKQHLETLKQQYDNIQKEIQETEGYSSSLQNKLLAKQEQIDKTSTSLTQNTEKLDQMGNALSEAGVDTQHLESESARLGEQMETIKVKQVEAADSATGFGTKSVQAVDAVGTALASAGIAKALDEIKDAYMACVTGAGDFQESMSNVEALSGASSGELEELSGMAKELGATTKFTAKESSEAMGYMAMAGWDVDDMLSGMDGVLQLAAASGEDLAQVSDIVTDSMSAFGLTAADTSHYADVLAATATNANTNVSIMGETFSSAASIAGALGYSVEDVSVAVGLMANNGVKGSVAGTALKNTFNGLLEGVTLTSSAFGEYNFSAVNADGTMKDFSTTIDQLRGYFDKMTDAEKVNNAQAIAGQRGYNGLLAILNATNKDYAELTDEINNCTGAAGRMADIKLDNMNGQLTLMQSAWDGLTISLGENFTPVMEDVYKLGTEVFDQLNDFVKEHPQLVKAVATFVGVVGAAAGGLAAVATVTKLVIPLMSTLGATIPGVNIVLGIAALTAGVVALTSATEEDIPKVKDLTTAAQEMSDTMAGANSTFADTIATTEAQAKVADMYIDKLEELETAGLETDEQQKQYHNTLELLAQSVPELADSINLTTDSIDGGTEALRINTKAWEDNAKAQAYQEYMSELQAQYNDVLVEQAKNEISLTDAQIKHEKASKGMDDTYQQLLTTMGLTDTEFKNIYGSVSNIAGVSLDPEIADQIISLRDKWEEYSDQVVENTEIEKTFTQAIAEDSDAVAEAEQVIGDAQAAYDELTGATDGLSGSQAAAAAEAQGLGDTLQGVANSMSPLIDAYNEAYSAAQESVSGQYALWDEAAGVVATSADTINTAMQSQITYWQDYNTNLQALNDRAADINGLSDVIASFADGSTESVNAIAGMASASDEDLSAMVTNWQNLQQEQQNASEGIADLETGFSNSTDQMVQDVTDAVQEMNLSDEATNAAKQTIQGFVDGANIMLPNVRAAYQAIADAANAALSSVDTSGVAGSGGSGSSSKAGSKTVPHNAAGALSAEEGFHLVGENGPELVYFEGGERIVSAGETQALQSRLSVGNYADAQNKAIAEYNAAMAVETPQEAYENQGIKLDGQTSESAKMGVATADATDNEQRPIYTDDEMQMIAIAPQLVTAMQEMSAASASGVESNSVEAISSNEYGGNTNTITVSPQYTITAPGGDPAAIQQVLNEHNADLRNLILEVVEESNADSIRRTYR